MSGLGLAEGIDDGEKRRCEQDSPEGDDDAQQDGHKNGGPDGHARDALEQPGLQQKLVDDDDDRIKTQHKAQAIKVASAEEDHHDRKDDGDDASKVGDEGHESADERPERRERYTEERKADPPEDGDAESFNGNGAPPVDERSSGYAGVVAGSAGVSAEVEGRHSL